MSRASIAADPSNEQYLGIHAVAAVPLLKHLQSLDAAAVTAEFRKVVDSTVCRDK